MALNDRQAGRLASGSAAWPKRAIALFVLLLAVVYSLVFFTGNKQAMPKLGIDLQGGTRVTLVPQGEQPTQDQLAQARAILEKRVNGMGVSGASVVTDGNTLVITVPGEDTSQARTLGETSQLVFRPVSEGSGVDYQSLPSAVEQMATRWVDAGVISKDAAQERVNAIYDELNSALANAAAQAGGEAPAQPEKSNITLNAEEPAKPENSIEAAELRSKQLEVLKADRQSEDPTTLAAASALMVCNDDPDPLAGADSPALPLVACDPTSGHNLVLEASPLLKGQQGVDGQRLTGSQIDTGSPITGGFNPQSGQNEITFRFKSSDGNEGAATWAQLTSENIGKQVAITLDSKVISAPVMRSAIPIGSATSIDGSFTTEEAIALANNLRYGALPLSFAGENGEVGGTATTVPATLGLASLKASLIAGIVGLILVSLFALAYYRLFGTLAIASLFASGAFIYGALVLLGRWLGYSLDLAGVAGLIIGIGTTADSFVVFYERIKDEVRDGRTFRSAVPRAWNRAKHTIMSGTFASLIAAVVLYVVAVGDVKGFAFTLGLTTIFDLVITFLVTAPLLVLASRRAWFARPAVNGLGRVMKVAQKRRSLGDSLPGDVAVSSTSPATDDPSTSGTAGTTGAK